MAVGVPLMAPVEVSNDSPAGTDGTIDHEVTVPPPEVVGVTVVIAVPFVSVNEFGVYVIVDGATSLTVMGTDAVELPPALVAVTV